MLKILFQTTKFGIMLVVYAKRWFMAAHLRSSKMVFWRCVKNQKKPIVCFADGETYISLDDWHFRSQITQVTQWVATSSQNRNLWIDISFDTMKDRHFNYELSLSPAIIEIEIGHQSTMELLTWRCFSLLWSLNSEQMRKASIHRCLVWFRRIASGLLW